ncbi:putative flavoprotein pyridine nucleotide cytochrome reductase [Plasmopara halstedii]
MQLCQSGQDLSGLRGGPARRAISMEEVNSHCTESDCWSVLDGKVYNLTPYLKYHPGGIAEVLLAAGGDCTDLFNEKHPWVNGHGMLDKCYIGLLDPTTVSLASETSRFALDRMQWRSFTLEHKQTVSQQTVKFTFKLPGTKVLGLTTPGQYLKVRAKINGVMIERAFTPTSKFTQVGSFDLLVKVYPNGVMSTYLDNLVVGDSVEMLGPQGMLGYPSAGVVTIESQLKMTNLHHVVMIAAGTGITPMLQLIRAIMDESKYLVKITLVDCNHSLNHIIALTQLEPLANMFTDRIKVHHVLHEASEEDAKELGSVQAGKRLDTALLAELLPKVSLKVAVFHCGPPAFNDAVSQMLRDIGYEKKQIFMF